MESTSELHRRLAKQERTIELLVKRVERFEKLETLLRDMEVDVACILTELRLGGFPNLLRGRRARVGHASQGAVLTPEAKRELRLRQAATARAGKRVGPGKGAVKDDETRRRVRAQAHGS